MDTEDNRVRLIKECWNKSFHAYGTSFIYEKRFKKYRKYFRLLTYFTFVIPLLIAGVLIGYGASSSILDWSLYLGTPLAIIQGLISLFSLTNGWSESLSYSRESKSSNYELYKEFESLAKFPPNSTRELQNKFAILSTMEHSREQQDSNHPPSQKEKREGMRWALRQFQRKCVTCKKVPTSMKPTECNTCGNF